MMNVVPGIRKREWHAVKRSSTRWTDHHLPPGPTDAASESIPGILEPVKPDTGLLRDTWFRIVSAYTTRKLTYQEDKLTALSGIANIIKDLPGWEYHAGTWDQFIIASLQWRTFDLQNRSAVYTAPTWSWPSCNNPVEFFSWNDETPVAEVLDIKCTPAGADRCGRVSDGYILVHGPVLEVTDARPRC